jgi:hypothetical protein
MWRSATGYLKRSGRNTLYTTYSNFVDGLINGYKYMRIWESYKLGEFKNPLRIESFVSSITVIVRDTWKNEIPEKYKDRVPTNFLKKKIELVLMKRNPTTFDEARFCSQWNECYVDERCSIAHGRGSKLIDPRTINKYNEITLSASLLLLLRYQ